MAESIVDIQVAAHRARNEKLVELIEEHGADLAETRAIDFFFDVSDQDAAAELARDLESEGFTSVSVSDEPHDGKWSIVAVRMDSVAAITDEVFVARLVGLAARHLADFDGWGTSV